MIGHLRGTLLEKHPPEVLVEVGGVGYEVALPMSCFYHLPEVGAEVRLYTHFVVREDAQLLYGFNHREERSLFRELLKANGVGPKLALAILSSMTATQFVAAVEREELGLLTKVPGVGKKTAERLLVELKDRLKGWGAGDLFTPATVDAAEVAKPSSSLNEAEAASALVALGYKPAQAAQMVTKIAKEGMSVEALIRDALRSQA